MTGKPYLTDYGRFADNPGVNRERCFLFPSAARLNLLTLHLSVIAAQAANSFGAAAIVLVSFLPIGGKP